MRVTIPSADPPSWGSRVGARKKEVVMKAPARVLLLASLALGPSEAAVPPVEITYIANEGYLIEVGSKKILIDAMFDDPTITYSHVPDEATLTRMRTSAAPFDGIDLVLFTHRHRDHFGIGPVYDHLVGGSSSTIVGPPQVVDGLRIVEPELDRHGDRVREVTLDLFGSAKLDVDGIQVRAFRLRHSEYLETDEATGRQFNRHEGVENLIYLIEVAGVSLLHVGDATLSQNLDFFDAGHFPKQEIDIVFLEFFDWSEETRGVLERWMTPDHVVFMHLPPEPQKIEQLTAHLSGLFPNAVVFDEPLQVKTF
jgi:L-ascorbate metabolism protein UlaG (beta-lactamase superfamily)